MIKDGEWVLYKDGRGLGREVAWSIGKVSGCMYPTDVNDDVDEVGEYYIIDEDGDHIIRYASAVKRYTLPRHIDELVEL